MARDRFASDRITPLDITQLALQFGQFRVERCLTCFKPFVLLVQDLELCSRNAELFFQFLHFGGQVTEVVSGQAQPPSFERGGNIVVFGRFRRLAACRVQLGFDFVDNVGQSFEILTNPFEFSLCFHLARFKAADSCRFFEDRAPTRRIPL